VHSSSTTSSSPSNVRRSSTPPRPSECIPTNPPPVPQPSSPLSWHTTSSGLQMQILSLRCTPASSPFYRKPSTAAQSRASTAASDSTATARALCTVHTYVSSSSLLLSLRGLGIN
jgi:hypothetical protein